MLKALKAYGAGLYRLMLLAGLSAFLAGAPGQAQSRTIAERPEVMSRQALALDLIRYGDRTRDALALIQAARMNQALGTRPRDGSKVSTEQLLQRARSYARNRQDLVLLIDDVAANSSRGAQKGPILEHFLAPVNEVQNLVVRFTGGIRAMFSLNADEPSKLEVEVLDDKGNVICKRSGSLSRECSWMPGSTGDYQIRVRNIGEATSEYALFHN